MVTYTFAEDVFGLGGGDWLPASGYGVGRHQEVAAGIFVDGFGA
jgi:hypothetical protein